MYKYDETTHNYFASLGYRPVLPTIYLGVSRGSLMLDCNVIVRVRLTGDVRAKPPTNKGDLGAKPPQFGKCLLGLYLLPYGPDEVRMSNLAVRLDC